MHERGWSIPETARRAGLPLPTVKNILYGDNSTHRTNTLEKLAKAFGCTIDNLVIDDLAIKEDKLDTDLFKECLDTVESYCSEKKLACEKGKMLKVVESLVSLYSKKKAKNEPYKIDDDTIEWIMGNIKN